MAMRTPLRLLAPLRAPARLANGLGFKHMSQPSLRTAQFHTTRASFLVVGEKIPPSTLMEKNPEDRIDLQKEIGTKKSLIIGVPAAFSGTCTQSHLPGYFSRLGDLRQRGIQDIYVISVNDPNPHYSPGIIELTLEIRFLADPQAVWVKAAHLDWDASAVMGNHRSKRFVAVVDDGVVSAIFIEPDNAGLTVTAADSVLASI